MSNLSINTELELLKIFAAGLKEYDADWREKGGTVLRDSSGRFASKSSDTETGDSKILKGEIKN